MGDSPPPQDVFAQPGWRCPRAGSPPSRAARTARRAADITGIALAEPGSAKQTRERSVIFYDTNEFDLYRNNFILRTRTPLGRARSAHQELVFKFLHPDRRTTVSVDPRPTAEIPHNQVQGAVSSGFAK